MRYPDNAKRAVTSFGRNDQDRLPRRWFVKVAQRVSEFRRKLTCRKRARPDGFEKIRQRQEFATRSFVGIDDADDFPKMALHVLNRKCQIRVIGDNNGNIAVAAVTIYQ